MHKKHAHIHTGHYQNVFKSAPYPIASYAMLLLHLQHGNWGQHDSGDLSDGSYVN